VYVCIPNLKLNFKLKLSFVCGIFNKKIFLDMEISEFNSCKQIVVNQVTLTRITEEKLSEFKKNRTVMKFKSGKSSDILNNNNIAS